MVSSKVEIVTRSYREDAKPVKWTCEGNPEFTIEDSTREGRGTDIILHINDESKEFLEESRINEMLKKYCRFLPIPIAFGTIKEWKDGKEVDRERNKMVNEKIRCGPASLQTLRMKTIRHFTRIYTLPRRIRCSISTSTWIIRST